VAVSRLSVRSAFADAVRALPRLPQPADDDAETAARRDQNIQMLGGKTTGDELPASLGALELLRELVDEFVQAAPTLFALLGPREMPLPGFDDAEVHQEMGQELLGDTPGVVVNRDSMSGGRPCVTRGREYQPGTIPEV